MKCQRVRSDCVFKAMSIQGTAPAPTTTTTTTVQRRRRRKKKGGGMAAALLPACDVCDFETVQKATQGPWTLGHPAGVEPAADPQAGGA